LLPARQALSTYPRGADWAPRYPWIVHSARRMPVTRFLIDGEVSAAMTMALLISSACILARMMRACSYTDSICCPLMEQTFEVSGSMTGAPTSAGY
jgi:hypothetical protein